MTILEQYYKRFYLFIYFSFYDSDIIWIQRAIKTKLLFETKIKMSKTQIPLCMMKYQLTDPHELLISSTANLVMTSLLPHGTVGTSAFYTTWRTKDIHEDGSRSEGVLKCWHVNP